MSTEDENRLAARLVELGMPDASSEAAYAIENDEPVEARWLLIRAARSAVDGWTSDNWANSKFAQVLVDQGANPDDVVRLMRDVAFEAAFSVVHAIDEEHDPYALDDSPGWVLMEMIHTDEPTLTGRIIGGIHESLGVIDQQDPLRGWT